MDDATYTLQQLSEISGIEARTIRSYIERALLPGPSGMGPKAAYGPEHRDRLNVIRRLRDAHREITLDQIRSFLSQLGPEKIAAIAAGEMKLGGVESGPPPISSALDYLMSIQGGSALPRPPRSAPRHRPAQRSAHVQGPPPAAAPSSVAPASPDSPAFPGAGRQRGARPLRDAAPSGPPWEEREAEPDAQEDFDVERWPGRAAGPDSPWSPESPATPGRTPFDELLGVLGAALTHENVSRSVRSETWLRVPITPDVELSVRGELDLDKLALLQRIGDHLRHLLMKGTRK